MIYVAFFITSIKESIAGILNVNTPAEAKLAVVKITLESGKTFTVTLRHKEFYINKTVFMYEAYHDGNCKSSSNCWNTLVRNDRDKYSPISYIQTHFDTDAFYNANVPHIVLPANTPLPKQYMIPSVLEYTMYK